MSYVQLRQGQNILRHQLESICVCIFIVEDLVSILSKKAQLFTDITSDQVVILLTGSLFLEVERHLSSKTFYISSDYFGSMMDILTPSTVPRFSITVGGCVSSFVADHLAGPTQLNSTGKKTSPCSAPINIITQNSNDHSLKRHEYIPDRFCMVRLYPKELIRVVTMLRRYLI